MTEVWKAIPGFEGAYEVSDMGRVRSLDRVIEKKQGPARYKGRVLSPAKRKKGGYWGIVLSVQGLQTSRLVHELVALTFKGPRPPGAWVAHGDGNTDNNTDGNLRYDTPSANHLDKVAHGTLRFCETHHNARLTRADVDDIRRRYPAESSVALGEEFGVGFDHITRICRGERWARHG